MTSKNRSWRRFARLARGLVAPTQLALLGAVPTFVLVPQAHAQQTPRLTLQTAIARAIDSDPGLQAAQADVDAARGGVRQARARPNPELSAEVENFNGRGELRGLTSAETTFSVSQEIELGGDRRARVRVADRELHGAELDRVLRGLDLVRDVQTAYFDALAAQELVSIARERLATAEALNVSIGRRVAAARDPLMAGARAEAGLAEARIALTRAEADAETARERLASLIGANAAAFVLPATDFGLPPASHAHDTPGNTTPDLARLAAVRDQATAATRVERSLAWQNPTLSFGYRRFEERDGEGALVAGVSFPLGVFDRNQGAIARSRAQERGAELELEAARRSLARDYAQLERQIAADRTAVLSIDSDVIPQAERALSLARDGYNRGGFSYLDVLEAQRALTDARESRVTSLRSFHTNEAALDRLTARFAEALPGQEQHP